jgi:hypothetical protein
MLVVMVQLVLRVPQAPLVLSAQLELRVLRDQLDLLEHKALKVFRAFRAFKVLMVPLAQQARHQLLLAQQVLQALLLRQHIHEQALPHLLRRQRSLLLMKSVLLRSIKTEYS